MSELSYRCGCGLWIEGPFAVVIDFIRMHDHDWEDVIWTVKESDRKETA